jgi:dTMP kinase
MAPETELFLYLACRAQLTREVITPALREGAIVLCDRFADATTVYQGYGRGLDLHLIAAMNRFATGGVMPDLTLLLDLDPGEGLNRVKERRQVSLDPFLDRLEAEDLEFHHRVRKGYLTVAKEEPHRFRVIDAAASEETIAQSIRDEVGALIDTWALQGGRR